MKHQISQRPPLRLIREILMPAIMDLTDFMCDKQYSLSAPLLLHSLFCFLSHHHQLPVGEFKCCYAFIKHPKTRKTGREQVTKELQSWATDLLTNTESCNHSHCVEKSTSGMTLFHFLNTGVDFAVVVYFIHILQFCFYCTVTSNLNKWGIPGLKWAKQITLGSSSF